MDLKLVLVFIAVLATTQVVSRHVVKQTQPHTDACDQVCNDLPKNDLDPVCMMISRYKRGYQHFVNMCHARRAICYENLVLHIVHPSRCIKSGQFFMPVN